MIIDKNLQTLPNWEKHVGPDIGGVTPTNYGWYQYNGLMVLYTQGPAYADWLAAQHRSILPNSGSLELSFDLMVDTTTSTSAQALEFDTILAQAGFKYNFSSQINYAEGGMLQIANQAGGWVDTGFKLGILSPGVWNNFLYNYKFDIASKIYSVVSLTLNGVIHPIPTTLQNILAQATNWADSVSVQIQQDLGPAGGSFSEMVNNVNLTWQ